jgi:hypothetical protein
MVMGIINLPSLPHNRNPTPFPRVTTIHVHHHHFIHIPHPHFRVPILELEELATAG